MSPDQIQQYNKAITAAVGTAVTTIAAAFGPDSDGGKAVTIIGAVILLALAVWAVPNKRKSDAQ